MRTKYFTSRHLSNRSISVEMKLVIIIYWCTVVMVVMKDPPRILSQRSSIVKSKGVIMKKNNLNFICKNIKRTKKKEKKPQPTYFHMSVRI